MILEVYLKILPIVLFDIIEFFILLADKLFAKPLRSLKTCVLVNNNLCRKLVPTLALPITFDQRFKVTSAPMYIPYSSLLSCELDNFMSKVSYCVILY